MSLSNLVSSNLPCHILFISLYINISVQFPYPIPSYPSSWDPNPNRGHSSWCPCWGCLFIFLSPVALENYVQTLIHNAKWKPRRYVGTQHPYYLECHFFVYFFTSYHSSNFIKSFFQSSQSFFSIGSNQFYNLITWSLASLVHILLVKSFF